MPRRIGLTLEEWPEADRSAWQRATSSINVFDEAAVAANWRPSTRKSARYAYARWLRHLRDMDSAALTVPLALRVTPERVREHVAALAQRNSDMSISAHLQHFWMALRALAPASDWTWIGKAQYAYSKRARPREKRHKIIDPRRLLHLGEALMAEAERTSHRMEGARAYRDGLIIALLIRLPLRRGAMAAIQLGRNLRDVGGRYRLDIDEADTKTGNAVQFDIPDELTHRLHRYLEDFRKRFPRGPTTSALWVSSKGAALTGDAIHQLVTKRTKAAFGFPLNPHIFRDIAATAIARESPEALHVARDLLTHAKLETTDKYYMQAQTADAARSFAAVVAGLRSSL